MGIKHFFWPYPESVTGNFFLYLERESSLRRPAMKTMDFAVGISMHCTLTLWKGPSLIAEWSKVLSRTVHYCIGFSLLHTCRFKFSTGSGP